jgi:hypothetical protein
MSITSYIGKIYYQCGMCSDLSLTEKYQWIGTITKQELKICAKCAKREGGKGWQEKSQRLKRLKQK